jgi:hypothetical protein
LNVCTPPASEAGGKKESGFCSSSGPFPGPGALALRSVFVGYGGFCSCCAAASPAAYIPAAAIPADPIPKNPRRETKPFVASSFITFSLFQ